MDLAMLLTQRIVTLKGIYFFGSVIVRSDGLIVSTATCHANTIPDPCLHDRCQHT